jgi:hypothetical protein
VEAAFLFDEPLESPSLRWLVWERGHYVGFTPPKIGEAVTLPPASLL